MELLCICKNIPRWPDEYGKEAMQVRRWPTYRLPRPEVSDPKRTSGDLVFSLRAQKCKISVPTFWTDPAAASFYARLAWKHLCALSITMHCHNMPSAYSVAFELQSVARAPSGNAITRRQ